MVVKINSLLISLVFVGLILLMGCASSPAAPVAPAVQPPKQSAPTQSQETEDQQANQETGPGNSTTDGTSAGTETPDAKINRVDVIYFHVNQRCVTCLCFEEHVNQVIEKYFTDAIDKGKLTYRVLNAQSSENAAIAKKYQVVGSQLFINKITKGVDHIEDIQQIWNWNCRNNPPAFELKVKNIIEQSLGGLG